MYLIKEPEIPMSDFVLIWSPLIVIDMFMNIGIRTWVYTSSLGSNAALIKCALFMALTSIFG